MSEKRTQPTASENKAMDQAGRAVSRYVETMALANLPGLGEREILIALLSAWLTQASLRGSREWVAGMLDGARHAVMTLDTEDIIQQAREASR